ncbi:MAG: hypothetical protein Q9182_001806 [Xanthomendoza sp. 2 TL-2023]
MEVFRVLNPEVPDPADVSNGTKCTGWQLRDSPRESIVPPGYEEDFIPYVPSDNDEPSTRTLKLDIEQLSYSEDHGSSTHLNQKDQSERSGSTSPASSGDSSYEDDSYNRLFTEKGGVHKQHSVSIARHDTKSMNGDLEDMDRDEEATEHDDKHISAKKGNSTRVKKLAAKPVGIVRFDDGRELQWFDPAQETWRPAVYHQDIRKELIKDAARLGKYRHELAKGRQKLDVTAFHPAYVDNGPDRQNWPKILFQYQPTRADFEHTKPGLWQLHDGRVVIDCNNDAMNDYAEIPVALSTKAESWLLLTCMRLNNHITIQDFRGRMMGERKLNMVDPLGRNRISMNMTRFRKFGCCLTWNSIRNVDTQREYLDKKLPRRCIRTNSTETFRKLYSWEVAESELQDAGKFLKRTRSRSKDVSPTKSQQVYKRKRAEVEQLKANFDRAYPDGTDDYDTEDEEYSKRRKVGDDSTWNSGAQINGSTSQIKTEIAGGKFPKNFERRGNKCIKRPTAKDTRILPYEPAVHGRAVQDARTICPRLHKDHGGFLTRAPKNIKEAQLVYNLLGPSRVHYAANTGDLAPVTFGDECYRCQWVDLQNALIEWHESHDVDEALAPAKIVGLQYVENGKLYWNAEWNDEWFGPQPKLNPDDLF